LYKNIKNNLKERHIDDDVIQYDTYPKKIDYFCRKKYKQDLKLHVFGISI